MPTDFRDGKTFPRRGREVIGEALWLLRVSDKGRAAAAGTIYDYIYPCPMDKGMLERWGVTPAEFGEALRENATDQSLFAWFSERVARRRRAAREHVASDRTARESRSSGR